MSESSWVLKGVDADARGRAVREAARRGISLADYLTDIVLQNALAEQALTPDAGRLDEAAPALLAPGQSFAIRHQIKTLERHLGSSVTSLDGALSALDGSLHDVTGRLSELEGQAGHTAEAIAEQVKGLSEDLANLRLGLIDIESAARASGKDNEHAHATLADACGELEQRLEGVEAVARGAEAAAAQVAQAQQAYRRSLAQDLDTLSRETAARVSAGLDQVRAAADEAAAHADAAASHLITELRTVRHAIDKRLAESAAETKQRMQAAFAESAQRITALSDRVAVGERQTERHAEHVSAQIADVEDGIQAAIEETALSLRRADAVLAADIVRVGENNRVALDALHGDIAAETAAMHERQLNATTRLANVEAKVAATSNQATAQHEALDRRISAANAMLRDALDQVDTTISEQFDVAASRATDLEQDIAHVRRTLGAEINRVEACTLAALEKQTHDRTAGDAAARRAIDENASATRAAVDDMRRRIEEQIAALRGQHASALARVDKVDTALAHDGPLATVISATAEEVASLRARVLGIQGAEREVAERVAKLENADANAAKARDGLHGRLESIAAQVPADQAERLRSLELSLADLRLGQLASTAPSPEEVSAEAVAAVQERVAEMEERQAASLHRLRNDIAQFVSENERRLALLEDVAPDLAAPFIGMERRLAELEKYDIGIAFAELRARIEDRILGVEQRNVRTLEQLSDTVALIERRFDAGEEERAARIA
jgi:hypothetical protein